MQHEEEHVGRKYKSEDKGWENIMTRYKYQRSKIREETKIGQGNI